LSPSARRLLAAARPRTEEGELVSRRPACALPRTTSWAASCPVRRTLAASKVEGMVAELFAAFSSGGMLMGWALHLGANPLLVALASITALAWCAGTATTLLLRRHHGPPAPAATAIPAPPPSRTLRQLLGKRKARTVLLYQVIWNAAIGLSAALFSLFMQRD